MVKYLSRRIASSLFALLVITFIVFLLTQLSGSLVDALLPDDATQEQIDSFIREWGLDKPLWQQYLTFLSNAVQGDFGTSLKWPGQDAMGFVLDRMPATLQLGGLAILMSVVIALPLGVAAAVYKGGSIDNGAQIFALFGQSMPSFWPG
ncbi:ABC transporter permease [Roseibium algae]|uniref:ABC transporter permease n=1 Tax=Roseibium algae TaxID=3123038 RepID=A0ABU8TSZ0_9HYPH